MTELSFRHAPAPTHGPGGDLRAVLYREFALLTRNRVNLVISVTPMLVYLLLVNTSLSNLVGQVEYRGTTLSYSLFLLPMVLIMSVVGAAGTTGVAMFQEEMSGVSTQLWSWPLRRSRFLFGKILAGVSVVVAQGLLALLVGVLVFRFPLDLERWLSLLLALVLASVAFTGLYLAVAIMVRDYQRFMVLTNVSMLVLVFAAPAMSTAQQLPAVVRWLSVVNPVTYAVTALRDAAVFGFGPALPSMAVLLAIAFTTNVLASRGLLRRTRKL